MTQLAAAVVLVPQGGDGLQENLDRGMECRKTRDFREFLAGQLGDLPESLSWSAYDLTRSTGEYCAHNSGDGPIGCYITRLKTLGVGTMGFRDPSDRDLQNEF